MTTTIGATAVPNITVPTGIGSGGIGIGSGGIGSTGAEGSHNHIPTWDQPHQQTSSRFDSSSSSSLVVATVGVAPTFWTHVPLFIRHLTHHLHVIRGIQSFVLKKKKKKNDENSNNDDDDDDIDDVALQQQQQKSAFASDGWHGKLDLPVFSSSPSLSSRTTTRQKIIPVSKCCLVGTIVNVERKSNGTNLYILDDGTGLMDVLQYSDGDVYTLPPISGQQQHHHHHHHPYTTNDAGNLGMQNRPLEPGDMVRIWGRIQCRVASVSSDLSNNNNNNNNNNTGMRINQPPPFLPATCLTREIHASVIVPLATASMNRCHARPNSIDHEWEHWTTCVKFWQSGSCWTNDDDDNDDNGSTSTGSTSSSGKSGTSDLPLLNNANDVLSLLGSDLVHSMLERNSDVSTTPPRTVPATDDEEQRRLTQAWRLFGTHCPCTNTAVKRELLYCHCTATRLINPTIDPDLVYRDALLTKLLDDEASMLAASNLPRPKSVDEIYTDIINDVVEDDDPTCHPFYVQYRSIAADVALNQIATQELAKSYSSSSSSSSIEHHQHSTGRKRDHDGDTMIHHTSNHHHHHHHPPPPTHKMGATTTVPELLRRTVRALRHDGILYLSDATTDRYLLLSRTRVLEPYVRTKLAVQKLSAERQRRYYEESSEGSLSSRFPYIPSVPRSRLEYVRRCALAATNKDPVA